VLVTRTMYWRGFLVTLEQVRPGELTAGSALIWSSVDDIASARSARFMEQLGGAFSLDKQESSDFQEVAEGWQQVLELYGESTSFQDQAAAFGREALERVVAGLDEEIAKTARIIASERINPAISEDERGLLISALQQRQQKLLEERQVHADALDPQSDPLGVVGLRNRLSHGDDEIKALEEQIAELRALIADSRRAFRDRTRKLQWLRRGLVVMLFVGVAIDLGLEPYTQSSVWLKLITALAAGAFLDLVLQPYLERALLARRIKSLCEECQLHMAVNDALGSMWEEIEAFVTELPESMARLQQSGVDLKEAADRLLEQYRDPRFR
jgi:hypothetical protein